MPDCLENKPGIISKFSLIKLPCSTNNKFLSQFNLYVSSGNQIKLEDIEVIGVLIKSVLLNVVSDQPK